MGLHFYLGSIQRRQGDNHRVKNDWMKSIVRAVVPLDVRVWIRTQKSKKSSSIKRLIGLKKDFRNREGLKNFDFTLFESRGKDGVSALLRVKNEAEKIHYCLISIYDLFDEIILVDNASEDGTLEMVRQFKARVDKEDKIKIYYYPFTIARCGQENFETPEDSVFSLAYYYNWALSKCTCNYICKWDGDMVLTKAAREPMRTLFLRMQKEYFKKMCWAFNGQTVYRDLNGDYYLAKAEINSEIMIFPYGYNTRYCKIELYEMLTFDQPLPYARLDGTTFYELKFTNENEFAHWSTQDGPPPTPRKKMEWENFFLIKRGDTSSDRFEKLPLDFLDNEMDN